MSVVLDLTGYEQRIVSELITSMGSALELGEVLGGAYRLLSSLVPADHGALCVSRASGPEAYDWAVAEMPPAFFQGYAEMMPHDFVRAAVTDRPREVLRDTEMLPRASIERSFLYNHCREAGVRLEHVMAVMLTDTALSWHGGLVLYRSRKVPFSERERALLQLLSPLFANAIEGARRFGDGSPRGPMLDALMKRQGIEVLVVSSENVEIARTSGVEAIFSKWFSPIERGHGSLPTVLAERLRSAAACILGDTPLDVWWRCGEHADLKVSLVRISERGRTLWAVQVEEVPQLVPVPEAWRKLLSRAETKVVERVCWDNALVAEDLGLSELTVKKHFTHVFDKLGVSSRAALIHLAWRLR